MQFEAADGAELVGDLASPASPRAVAVLCHPHPRFGGNRYHPLIAALHAALPQAGIASLRFDFRADFADGVGERLDALAALDRLDTAVPDLPMALVGYSFGAWIALSARDQRITAVVAVAPPLAAMTAPPMPVAPTLVLTPAHDQFSAPVQNDEVIAAWRADGASVDHHIVEMADHYLAGAISGVTQCCVDWMSTQHRLS